MSTIQLVTLAPGHFHAALIQKEMPPGIDPTVRVYAPLDGDLVAHLNRVASFNHRPTRPTSWILDVHAGSDWLERFQSDRPGNAVVLSGRNRRKIELMQRAIDAGMHVLADKPWIIDSADWPRLAETIERASRAGLVVHDVMTERFEVTSILQREIVRDPEVFGDIVEGDPQNPAVVMESVHHLKKNVAGAPLIRPQWFFDIHEQGETLADVGTHLVDQVLWILFTDSPIVDVSTIKICNAERWRTPLDRQQFAAITGRPDFPADLSQWITENRLDFFCNNRVTFQIRNVCVRLDALWNFESSVDGGDTHHALFRGTRSSVIIRQKPNGPPELFVAPTNKNRQEIRKRLARRVETWIPRYPGVRLIDVDESEFHIAIPPIHRTGHEAHFAEVASEFLTRIADQKTIPPWETANHLAKYYITTHGVAAARS